MMGAALTDEPVSFLNDIFPTGYQTAEYGNIPGGETVTILGCGPVGQFAIKSAYMLGAGRVIAIDRFPERLETARGEGGVPRLSITKRARSIRRL
jgi:threonine dehydrogenase-like Zn-dependent dehydrogenase